MTTLPCLACLVLICQPPSRPSVLSLSESIIPDVVIAGMNDRIVAFNGSSGQILKTDFRNDGPTTAISIDHSRQLIAMASGRPGEAGSIDLARLGSNGQPTEQIGRLTGQTDQLFALAFQPKGGRFLVGAGYGRVIHVWDIEKKQQIMAIRDHSDTIRGMDWHPTQPWLATCAADRTVKIWEFPSGRCLHSINDSTDWLNSLHWDTQGKHIVAGGVDRSIRLWEINSNGFTLKKSKFAHDRPILSIGHFGSQWLSMGEDKKLKSWSGLELTESGIVGPLDAPLASMAVARDGKSAWLGGFDGRIRRIETTPLKVKATFDIVAAPKVTSFLPNHIPRGSKFSILLTGNGLNQIDWKQVRLNEATVGTVEVALDGHSVAIEVDVASDLIPGPRVLDYPLPSGGRASHAIEITLKPRNPVSESADLSYQGHLARAGQIDRIPFFATKGQETGVLLTTSNAKGLDPVIRIVTRNGHILTEGARSIAHVFSKTDQYYIEIHDKEYRHGDQQYWLHAGNIPVVAAILPSAIQAGHSGTFNLLGVNLGKHQVIQLQANSNAMAQSRLDLPEALKRIPGVVGPTVTTWPQHTQSETAFHPPFGASGTLSCDHQAGIWKFHGQKGKRLILDINASRNGSPLDSLLEIRDNNGLTVPRMLLQPVAQTIVVFRNHDAKNPGIRLETWPDLSANDFLYAGGDLMRIRALPRNPDDDCQFFATNGKRLGWLGTTPTQHPIGQALLKVIPKPPGYPIESGAWPPVLIPSINDDGPPEFGRDSMLLFDPPADGEYQAIVSEASGTPRNGSYYQLTVRPATEDFAFSIKSSNVTMSQNGSAEISIDINRKDGWTGPLNFEIFGLPEGWLAPMAYASEMENTVVLAIQKSNDTAKWPTQFSIKAHAILDGKPVSRDVVGPKITSIPSGDVTIRPELTQLQIIPGNKARLPVVITRKTGFEGRVPIDVRGLPQGVRVLDIGLNGILLTPGQSRRVLEIEADEWVSPQSTPFVITARKEGQPEYIGPLIELRVESIKRPK